MAAINWYTSRLAWLQGVCVTPFHQPAHYITLHYTTLHPALILDSNKTFLKSKESKNKRQFLITWSSIFFGFLCLFTGFSQAVVPPRLIVCVSFSPPKKKKRKEKPEAKRGHFLPSPFLLESWLARDNRTAHPTNRSAASLKFNQSDESKGGTSLLGDQGLPGYGSISNTFILTTYGRFKRQRIMFYTHYLVT